MREAVKRLGVLGWPVAHSRSPAMHAAAFAALSMPGWRYQRLPVPPELLEETVRALPGAGFVGANVTIPHKHAALALAGEAGDAATEIGAANTLLFADDGAIRAENTDAAGIVAALEQMLAAEPAAAGAHGSHAMLAGVSVLVLGAGGSARAAVWGLLRAGAADVAVWNRTAERAHALVRGLGGRAVAAPVSADVLVNCTSVGLGYVAKPGHCEPESRLEQSSSEVAALNQLALGIDQLREYSHVVDLVYRTGGTPLLNAARRLGAQTLDGVEILVQQGALSFELWTGVRPPLDAMREGARAD